MYTLTNFRTKKAMKEALAEAQAAGRPGLPCYQPGPFGPRVRPGVQCAEGPHSPEPHKWYASCIVESHGDQDFIVKVKR